MNYINNWIIIKEKKCLKALYNWAKLIIIISKNINLRQI